jgi:hypothetical protein
MIYQILALFIWSSSFVAAKYTFTMMDTILMIQARNGGDYCDATLFSSLERRV